MAWWMAMLLLAALLALIGLAWWRWMRSDDEMEDRLPERTDLDVVLPAEVPAAPEGVVALVPEDALDPEPGEEYADELHRINLEARADSWRYDSLAVLLQPPRWMTKVGYSGEDILRFYLPHAEYMAELDRAHRAWLERWGAEQAAWKARQLRGIRRYRGLGAAA